MSKLQLILLGHFDCLLPSGERISLSMRKAEVLLAYLALAPGIRHPRERLLNLLWSDRSDEQARNSLRQCLSTIKKSLGDAADLVIQVDRTTVCLSLDLVDVDALEFERLSADSGLDALSNAATLYGGEFLEGIAIRDAACQDWLEAERGRFKRQYIEILTNLGHTLLASRDLSASIKIAEKLVTEDSLGESGWRLLMRAYADNGDRSHALQAFKRCQQALRAELDVEPEAETLGLRDQIAASQTKPAPMPPGDRAAQDIAAAPSHASTDDKASVDRLPTSDHRIAVLPFDNLSGDPEQEYFSDGITDSIILNLSMFPDLQVKSRNSSFAFKQQIKSLGEISQELNVDYVVEGSIRKSHDRVRITVQLIEAANGNQIWGKRYDADIENLFDLEEELSRSIAATVTGQIESDLQRIAIAKSAADQQSYDLLLAGTYHMHRFNPRDNAIAIDKLNQCLSMDPQNVRAHADLVYCHAVSWMERWVVDRQGSLDLARKHALKAIELEPDLNLVLLANAEYLTFYQEPDKAWTYVERVLQANPNDTEALAMKAMHLEFRGDFEAALETAQLVYQLDPYHPWNQWNIAESQYLCGQYEAALETISKTGNAPGFIRIYNVAANVKLGRMTKAREQLEIYLQECSESMPEMPITTAEWLSHSRDNAPFKDSSINQDHIECMVLAGYTEDPGSSQNSDYGSDQPTILVLPFANLSGDPEQEYFSDGITESIILSLSSFSGLKVKSRHASFAFKNSPRSISEISEELGVQYIVEGSIRKFGDQVRITVQLGDASNGNQLWGKRFDSSLSELFSLEEEMVKSIAGTISGRIGKEIKNAAISKPAKDLKSYDYLMRGLFHLEKFSPSDNLIAREQFEKCLERDSGNGEACSLLGITYVMDLYENWTVDRDEARRLMRIHADRAVELEPDNALAHAFTSEQLLMNREFERALFHAERAIELNPTLPDGYSMKCGVLVAMGRHDEALEYADISMQIDSYHPYIGWNAGEVYRTTGQYERAVKVFRSIPHIPPSLHAQIAASLAGMGNIDEARAEMQRYLELAQAQMPNVPKNETGWRKLWYEFISYLHEDDSNTFFNLLLKAGLCDESVVNPDDLPSILVLPFKNISGDPEQEYFSDGISESIISSLGAYSGPRVKSRHTSFAFKNSSKCLEEIATELEVNYIVEGSIRKSADRVRINVQLVESASGDQLWAKRFDSDLNDLLTLEDELTNTIAATISGRIGKEIKSLSLHKPMQNLQSYDYLMRGLYHMEKFTAEDVRIGREQLLKSIAHDPQNAEATAILASSHIIDLYENWSADRNESKRLMKFYGQRALEIEPDNAMAHTLQAEQLVFARDYQRAETHIERAIEINPTLPDGYSLKAALMSCVRRYDEALENAELAMQLDPYHPYSGWVAGEVLRTIGQFERAIKAFRSVPYSSPGLRAQTAAALVGLGKMDEARAEMKAYLELAHAQMPRYPGSEFEWRELWSECVAYQFKEESNTLFDQLLQAGLCAEIEVANDAAPSIAVMPFENMSADPEQEFFNDGITTDIIATLSKFQNMRVISRHSTHQYKNRKASITEIASEQSVRYILEGSVRKSGEKIRVNAELIDVHSEQNIWSERYDRKLDNIFTVQDEITRNIAVALKVKLTDGERSASRTAGTRNMKAWELVLLATDLQDSYIRQNVMDARKMVLQAIELDPQYAYARIGLGWTHWQEAYSGWTDSFEQSLLDATAAVEKSLELEPDNAEAWILASTIHITNHEPDDVITASNRALELEPGNAEVQALAGFAMNFIGDYEKATEHFNKALDLCPFCPNWYYLVGAQPYRDTGNLVKAEELLRRGITAEPDSPLCRFYLAEMLLEQGNEIEAQEIAAEIRKLDRIMNGRGLTRSYSNDAGIRNRFLHNLEKLGLA